MAYRTGGRVKKFTRKTNKTQKKGKQPKKKQGEVNQQEKKLIHHEDLALKTATQYFGEELLPLLGISGEIMFIAPTETVKLEARKMYQDFNYAVSDSTWIHLEFESDAITKEDLRRFREYEAATSRTYKVEVITYVICSAQVKHPMTVLKEGINSYHVKVIRLQGRSSDRLFKLVKEKLKKGMPLEKADLVPLLLTPLMSGSLRIDERIIKSLKILQEAGGAITQTEREKMQAVLYTLADKFLSKTELDKVKEIITMTRLGEMLVEDGIKKGMEKGMEKGFVEAYKDLGISFEKTVEKIKQRFGTSEEEARKTVSNYWN